MYILLLDFKVSYFNHSKDVYLSFYVLYVKFCANRQNTIRITFFKICLQMTKWSFKVFHLHSFISSPSPFAGLLTGVHIIEGVTNPSVIVIFRLLSRRVFMVSNFLGAFYGCIYPFVIILEFNLLGDSLYWVSCDEYIFGPLCPSFLDRALLWVRDCNWEFITCIERMPCEVEDRGDVCAFCTINSK